MTCFCLVGLVGLWDSLSHVFAEGLERGDVLRVNIQGSVNAEVTLVTFFQDEEFWQGGLSIHGAIFGGMVTAIFYCRKQVLPLATSPMR